jgi:hypothetical protein
MFLYQTQTQMKCFVYQTQTQMRNETFC